jgi:hypothetical protein
MLQLASHIQAGQRLKCAMRARSWSLVDLSAATGLSVRTCCTLQHGQGSVSNYTRVCIALGIPTGLAVGNPSGRHLYNSEWAWSAQTLGAEARRIAKFEMPEEVLSTPETHWRPFWQLRGRIDVDPFSPETGPTVECSTFYNRWQNVFLHDWFGIVWLQPNYDRVSMRALAEKVPRELTSGRIELMAALLMNRTTTAWSKMVRATGATIFHFTDGIKFGCLTIKAPFDSQMAVWLATDDELDQLARTLPPNFR